ncbi:SusD/RagB family nutrient-binding outer membrane lipoprotein [Pedobacter sp. PAMC26386]|nr:SusD/RagB family nutrient-binding outer membrane lipoprotein [Pedobacter sp. PAMC26386]
MRTNNIINPKKLLLLLFIAVIGFSGCKKFLDINQNPNNPDSADPNLLLPTVQAAVGQLVGNAFQVYGGIWAQYWTQSPNSGQYKTIDQYNLANTAFDRPWLTIYRNALVNSEAIINDKTPNIEYTRGIAYLMKAYTVQVTTDAFGDIPVAEAVNYAKYPAPHYQSQEIVYDSIFKFIDKGVALLSVTSPLSPGSQDLVFNGSAVKWKAFANTLKLKAYLRIAYVNPAKANAGITALYAASPTFLTEDAAIKYLTIGGNENPLYNEMVGLSRTQNLVASKTAVDAYVKNNDTRLLKFYNPIATGDQTKITAIPQGSYQANAGSVVSIPTALVGADPLLTASATAPVKLFSAAESYFLQAEAVARGYAAGDVNTLYTQGISASFSATGNPADAAAYTATAPDGLLALTSAADVEGKVKAIITQKYYALNGFQGFEAWTEYRRTGYPTFLVLSVASQLGGNRMPQRMLYPSSEALSNSNFPGSLPLYTPVWWATKK